MPDWSRRHALQAAAAAGAFALAGCSGTSSSSREVPRERDDPVDVAETTFVRDTDGEPLFRIGDEPRRPGSYEYLTSTSDREEVTFRSSPAASDLRAFVEATDFESESVYLVSRPIGACYEARLVGVYREGNGIDADFCNALRPADVACEADDEDTVGVGIRLPFVEEEFNSFGLGWSGDCGPRPTVAREGGDGV